MGHVLQDHVLGDVGIAKAKDRPKAASLNSDRQVIRLR